MSNTYMIHVCRLRQNIERIEGIEILRLSTCMWLSSDVDKTELMLADVTRAVVGVVEKQGEF